MFERLNLTTRQNMSNYQEPKRILQIFDPVAQAAYRNWSAKDRLEWLGSIQKLYWAAIDQQNASQPGMVRDKDKND